MEKIIAFIERLYNSIVYNGFYIILSFLFPFIIYKLDAGHEIIENILDNHVGLNASLIVSSFALLAFSVWCVPTLAIGIWKFFTGNTSDNSTLYKYLTVIYSGAGFNEDQQCVDKKVKPHLQIPIKYFAVLPWMLFIFTYVQVFFHTKDTVFAAVFLIAVFVFIDKNIPLIKRFYDGWLFGNNRTGMALRLRYFSFFAVFLVLNFIPLYIDWISPGFLSNSKWSACILIGVNYLLLFLFYTFINYLENITNIEDDTRYKISNYNYLFVSILSVLLVFLFFSMNASSKISMFSPIFIVVTIMSVLIMFFDIFFTAQLLLTQIIREIKSKCTVTGCKLETSPDAKLDGYRLIINLLAISFVFFTFFHSFNDHKIREVESNVSETITDNRKTIDDYFKTWLAKNHNITDTIVKDPITIYLISGPGGGSRAAAWFYLGMKRLDSIYGDKFYKHVFSISTVSGSTSGANMYLAEKHLKLDTIPPSEELARAIYSKNYFSSTFFGLLMGDGVEGMIGTFNNQTRNRNFYFQKEEMNGFIDAYKLKGYNRTRAKRYFENDMMYSYTNETPPLFFINTTIIDYGKRGIFAPVKLNSFSFGVDLYDKYVNNCCNNRHGIPMVTCVNSSQAFPLINSYDYLQGAGRLCDGGLYDNSGCSTTLEIYQALRHYIKEHRMNNINIVCLNINNGDITNDFCAKHTSSSILNTLTGVASLPFSGNEAYAFDNLKRQIKNHLFTCKLNNGSFPFSDTVVTIKPTKKYNLTRMLSKKAIDSISKDVTRQVNKIQTVFIGKKTITKPNPKKQG